MKNVKGCVSNSTEAPAWRGMATSLKTFALALLLLVMHSAASQAAGPSDRNRSGAQSAAEEHSRPVSDHNPFGIDYGFHPAMFLIRPSGVPTPQFSMYHAQIKFAESRCTTTPKPTKPQVIFYNFFLYAYDQDLDKPYKAAYAQAVEGIKTKYQNAWEGVDEAQRAKFCADYSSDIDSLWEGSALARGNRFRVVSMFYRVALAPLSTETIEELERKAKAKEEREKLLAPIAFLGQALAATAGLSASMDALSAVNSGKLSLSQLRLQQSYALNRVASDFGNVAILARANENSQAVPAPAGPQSGCQALDHFDQYGADPDSEVWRKYQRLTSDCEALKYMRVE
jgi:hypothetical protein